MEAEMDTRALSVADIALTELDGEPRARDVDIAERLGFDRPRDVRKLIERNLAEIEGFGVCATVAQTSGPDGGRPSTEFWLNEEQALLVSIMSKAPHAPAVRAMLIRVFVAYRRGRSAPTADLSSVQAMLSQMVREQVVIEIARGMSIRPGKSAGRVWRDLGLPAAKRGDAQWFAGRLKTAGCAAPDGGRAEIGCNDVRLFDLDKARIWINNGGRFLVMQRVSEREGQGKLHLVGKAI